MSDQHKLAVLTFLTDSITPGMPARLGFNSLSKSLNLSKQELDALLTDLNKLRFISHYAKKGVDGFTLVINQKGVDAVQDGSFL